jgi:membrane-bound ClpP family serine protease
MTPDQHTPVKEQWDIVGEVKPKGQLLKLTATQAKELGLVKFVLDGADPTELYAKYGIEPGKVKEATPAWLDQFRNFLREPSVTAILVLVGFIGLILELKVPGTTIPGIVSALCFILVFWAWTGFSGQLAVLAGLLFLLGLILILLEVFVLPGFGAPGVIGIILMLGSLALVTVDKIPESGSDWLNLGKQAAYLMFLMIGGLIGAFVIARYLPKVPIANRMVLAPTAEREASDPTVLPGAAQAANLLGAIGVTTTVLRPAGTVQFGDEYVDVVSDGDFIPAGTRVQVIEVEGTRIVVKVV